MIETTLFKRLAEAEGQAVAAAFPRYAEFLELPVMMAYMQRKEVIRLSSHCILLEFEIIPV